MRPIGIDWRVALGATLALLVVLTALRSLPFLTTPENLQAFWVMGFAQSFANQSLMSIHAVNFGLPEPTPIMFGLAGAYLASLFLAVGLQPADAYAVTVALWFSLAFLSAWRLSSLLGATGHTATLMATLWLTMPIVFGHVGYSMVACGIALLPWYFLTAIRLWSMQTETSVNIRLRDAALFWLACLVSIFMDGYSFVMFAVGTSLLAAYRLLRYPFGRARLLLLAGTVHGSGFAVAYVMYTAYVGRSEFEANSLDFFRGFGADATFFLVPTATVYWLWDALGLSVVRTRMHYFGDPSVWTTTYSLPMIIVGLVAWWRTRATNRLSTGVLVLALFGFYMALGPSLKIDSVRPPVSVAHPDPSQLDSTMPAELAVMPTGSGWLSENLPGFRNMRAAYRWTALGLFGMWVLAILMLAQTQGWYRVAGLVVVGFIVLSDIPNLRTGVEQGMANRRLFAAIDETLVANLRTTVSPSEKMAILPFDNDFLAGYLAARANIHVYNIGGDKNLANAQRHWPRLLLQMGDVNKSFSGRILLLLAEQNVDVVLLPYVDLEKIGFGRVEHLLPPPLKGKGLMVPVVSELRKFEHLVVDEWPQFALVRLAPEYRGKPMAEIVYRALLSGMPFPWTPPRSGIALVDGWHEPEIKHVWSGERATLNLPVPENCGACYAFLEFGVLAASEENPVAVRFSLGKEGASDYWTKSLHLHKSHGHSLAIPMKGRPGLQRLTIAAAARSPSSLGIGVDERALGLALRSVDMLAMRYPLSIADKPDPRHLAFALSEGWHVPEAEHVWSEGRAGINVPLPDRCGASDCYAFLKFGVFAAAADHPVTVQFSLTGEGTDTRWTKTLVARRPDGHALAIPMRGRRGLQKLTLEVVGAVSPKDMQLSGDERIIGISLRSMEMIAPGDYSLRIGEVGQAATRGFVLSEGWHSAEPGHVWSEGRAAMNLPVPRQCEDCGVQLKFGVFAASESRPVAVQFTLSGDDGTGPWTETLVAHGPGGQSVFIPMKGRHGLQHLAIEVPLATSPQALGMSEDARVLGIALRSAEIVSHAKAAQQLLSR